jgi:hypothetical protein
MNGLHATQETEEGWDVDAAPSRPQDAPKVATTAKVARGTTGPPRDGRAPHSRDLAAHHTDPLLHPASIANARDVVQEAAGTASEVAHLSHTKCF